MSARKTMLGFARAAIQARANADGYEPGAYDAGRDPEGYVTSLLTALHLWSHAHGIDWENELIRAQGFFEQDLEESGQPVAEPVSKPPISNLQCPACGHEESFVIEVTECLLMFADGVVLDSDAGDEWGDWSHCRCHECCHRGTVYQFRKVNQTGKEVITSG